MVARRGWAPACDVVPCGLCSDLSSLTVDCLCHSVAITRCERASGPSPHSFGLRPRWNIIVVIAISVVMITKMMVTTTITAKFVMVVMLMWTLRIVMAMMMMMMRMMTDGDHRDGDGPPSGSLV